MNITISGHTVPVRDMDHAERLLEIADGLDQDALEQWLYAGAPELRKPTVEEEHQILSVGREFLPACAIAVLDGEPATPEYREWLADQLEQMDSENA